MIYQGNVMREWGVEDIRSLLSILNLAFVPDADVRLLFYSLGCTPVNQAERLGCTPGNMCTS